MQRLLLESAAKLSEKVACPSTASRHSAVAEHMVDGIPLPDSSHDPLSSTVRPQLSTGTTPLATSPVQKV